MKDLLRAYNRGETVSVAYQGETRLGCGEHPVMQSVVSGVEHFLRGDQLQLLGEAISTQLSTAPCVVLSRAVLQDQRLSAQKSPVGRKSVEDPISDSEQEHTDVDVDYVMVEDPPPAQPRAS
eukprot:TRINITY_DN1900_c0_g1_i3.p1 TRINITY_DN1900_c0_g1~~TRINITY_DN1900_c0_g1_i3.p1  ORF type:complete len:122 (-),score=27.19 TRINITY_DN1900_c0_g1_i3:447-812(-)